MKKRFHLILLGCLFLANAVSSQVVVVVAGQVLTVPSNTTVSYPDGVIIMNGGELRLQSGVLASIGVGKSITIQNGGMLKAFNATITVTDESLHLNNWTGLKIEGNSVTAPAVEMVGGAIRRAYIAAHLGQSGFRRVSFTGTQFENNSFHVVATGQTAQALIQNGSRFVNCHFLRASEPTPVLVNYMNDLQFTGCLFDYQSSNVDDMMHFDGPRNLIIDHCTFVYTKTAIYLHKNVDGITVSNSEFYFDHAFLPGANNNVIVVGVFASDVSRNVTIEKNKIYRINTGTVRNSINVASGNNSNLLITGNEIGLGNPGEVPCFNSGISVSNCNQGPSFNIVSENIIESCVNGVHAVADNSSLIISCNILIGNVTQLLVSGLLNDQSPDGMDPGNKFINGGRDIYNSSGSLFTYYTLNYVTMNSFPPMINTGVNIVFVDLGVGCTTPVPGNHDGRDRYDGGESGGRSNDHFKEAITAVNVFPNPASDVVNGMVSLDADQSAAVSVRSMTGAILMEQQISGSQQVSFDINTLPAGTYLFSVIKDSGEQVTKRFVVMR